MKLLAVVLFALSTFVGAPRACEHALSPDTPQTATSVHENHRDVSGHIAHHEAERAAHHDSHGANDAAPGHVGHQSCPTGCEGGAGCDGCTVAMSAVTAISSDTPTPDFSVALPQARSLCPGQTIGIDPPPPRVLSL